MIFWWSHSWIPGLHSRIQLKDMEWFFFYVSERGSALGIINVQEMKLHTTQWYRGRFLKNSLATIMTCKTQMFRIKVTAPKREIWKRIICFYLIGNTRRMILNIVQSLFRRLGVDVPHKQKCRDGMEENQWQQGMNMWKRWQQLEIECWQHQIHIKSDMNGAKWG